MSNRRKSDIKSADFISGMIHEIYLPMNIHLTSEETDTLSLTFSDNEQLRACGGKLIAQANNNDVLEQQRIAWEARQANEQKGS